MPDIGEGIAEAEVVEWLVQVGDRVAEDQVVATIQTDKSVVEMPSPVAGVVAALGVDAGEVLAVGAVLLAFEAADGASPAGTDMAHPVVSSETAPPVEPAPLATVAPVRRPRAAPAVRKLALDHDVDLTGVAGSGPNGRITRDDVLAATEAPPTTPIPVPAPVLGAERRSPSVSELGPCETTRVPLRGLRRQIAKKMVETWQTVPHITDYREADATRLIEARAQLRDAAPDGAASLTFVPFLVKIIAVALVEHPLLNASIDMDAEEYVLHQAINIGIATSTPDGLVVPVVRDADRKSIREIAEDVRDLVSRARAGRGSREDFGGGTYTVNNLGGIGTTMGTPIIRTPEVGIMGFGRIADRVVAVNGVPVVRPTLMLSSVGDHRLHDGDTLSGFTTAVVRLIETPYLLLAGLH